MVVISSDSTADLCQLFGEFSIPVLPLIVSLEGKDYYDGVTIEPRTIFESYAKNKTLPKTAARSIEDYREFFRENKKKNDSLIHFCISSELSSSYNNALLASNDFDNVFVVDTKSLSTGMGLLVLKARDYAIAGMDGKQIFEEINKLVPFVQASFVVDTMEYLYKGGRCSGLTNFVASALKIRPMLILKDGFITVGQKFMGSMEKIIVKYVDAILQQFDSPDYGRIFITHTYAEPEIVELVRNRIKEKAPDFKEIIETYAGCTVTSHCGKGTLGILYINKSQENS